MRTKDVIQSLVGTKEMVVKDFFLEAETNRYQIDRVIDVRPGYAAKAGGQGDRYTIQVNGKRTCIYFERAVNPIGSIIGRWFVERKVPLVDTGT